MRDADEDADSGHVARSPDSGDTAGDDPMDGGPEESQEAQGTRDRQEGSRNSGETTTRRRTRSTPTLRKRVIWTRLREGGGGANQLGAQQGIQRLPTRTVGRGDPGAAVEDADAGAQGRRRMEEPKRQPQPQDEGGEEAEKARQAARPTHRIY